MKYSVKTAVKKIGIPVLDWPGRCYEIACALVRCGYVRGTAVYGHWHGPVSADAPVFGAQRDRVFQRHGWVSMPDGSVVDPTRWVFEAAAPYIYHGPSDHYDEGGNQIRAALLRPPPPYDPAQAVDIKLKPGALTFCREMLKHDGFSRGQIFWLANLPYDQLGPHVAEVYVAIAKSPMGYTPIPIDNAMRAEREFGVNITNREHASAAARIAKKEKNCKHVWAKTDDPLDSWCLKCKIPNGLKETG